MKSIKALIVLLGVCFLTTGCEASKGFARGIKEDFSGFWGNAKKVDSWWEENLW